MIVKFQNGIGLPPRRDFSLTALLSIEINYRNIVTFEVYNRVVHSLREVFPAIRGERKKILPSVIIPHSR